MTDIVTPPDGSGPPPPKNPPTTPDLPVPVHLSAESLTRCALFTDATITPRTMRQMMESAQADDQFHEETLARQAQVLDALFHRLVVKALTSPYKGRADDPAYVDNDRLDLALRAQRQCRNTVGTIQLLKAMQKGGGSFCDKQTNDEA